MFLKLIQTRTLCNSNKKTFQQDAYRPLKQGIPYLPCLGYTTPRYPTPWIPYPSSWITHPQGTLPLWTPYHPQKGPGTIDTLPPRYPTPQICYPPYLTHLNTLPPGYSNLLPPSPQYPTTPMTHPSKDLVPGIPYPLRGQTDTCDNVTFPQLRFRSVPPKRFKVDHGSIDYTLGIFDNVYCLHLSYQPTCVLITKALVGRDDTVKQLLIG